VRYCSCVGAIGGGAEANYHNQLTIVSTLRRDPAAYLPTDSYA